MQIGWRKTAELTHGASFLPPPGGGGAWGRWRDFSTGAAGNSSPCVEGSAFDALKVPSRCSVQNFEPLRVNKRHIWNPDLPQWRCFGPASTLPETARKRRDTGAISLLDLSRANACVS